ncbi:hypothetical protein C8Q77DRAFT_1155735 [Trametes polyzona]|nr:hypothetical protein C8Q77DRAFT_1155735 [Trametes polyzona]
MAKPRNSVLFLFDPLQQSPSTPRRDSSPELGASDKENDVPPGDVTMFFDRMYAAPKQQDARPHTPSGKLIDIGDTPAKDKLWDDTEHAGSDADEEQSEYEVDSRGTIIAPSRTPLADLEVEDTPKPQPDTRRPFQASVLASATSPSRQEQPLRALLAAPQGSPLAEVINSINLSALAISHDGTPTAEKPSSLDNVATQSGRPPSPFPEITVCAPETPSMPEFDLGRDEKPSGSPTANGTTLRPPSTLTQLSPDDPRRTSIDLYSSFHLQMQSSDMSFDLLNDKISFLGNGQDSFWAGGEDAMLDFDEENQVPTKNHKVIPESIEESRGTRFHRVFSPPKATVNAAEIPSVNSPPLAATMVPLPMSPPPSSPSPHITPPRTSQQASPPSPPTSPVSLDEPSLMLESEPLPPSVPALRIVKKTFTLTGRRGSASETSESRPASRSTDKSELSAKKTTPTAALVTAAVAPRTEAPTVPVVAPQPQAPRPNYRGVQRPPPSMLAAGVVIGLPPQGSLHNTSASTSSSSSAGSSASRSARSQDGSRFAAAGIRRPALPSKERTVPRNTTAAAATVGRTVKAPASTSGMNRAASTSATVSKSSGLRPPSRIAAPGAAAGSTLPRPASRLPGPSVSGLARHASTGGSAIGRPRAVTAPRAPAGGRF